ncbi:unnamed protein product [Kuraishia capsulata CBS 1993]|uniref:Uncharacterized protein n=1 Tax=Kuraishia capsulata CBS 1993 TaxID=1382522 RepID=W6MUU7_9ASCO|nr:uncharacterized protein KUCA_T00001901001 [Kuraishia capsulata CBS 1993]CDK25930.1 unnamed protein product [Kuraishia capsulata CBS 1993]
MDSTNGEGVSIEDKLDRIRLQINSKLDNQKQLAIILSAVEENIEEQKTKKSEVAYFVSFLGLLQQSIQNDEIVDLSLATVSAYFLDLFFPYLPAQLLKSRFSDILTMLAPALTNEASEAPLIRSSVGALEALLLAQDHASWGSNVSVSPRRGLYGLLELSLDPRPKVRKRAQEAVHKILSLPPPGPTVEHPAANLPAEFVLESLVELLKSRNKNKAHTDKDLSSKMIHNLQLITSITSANAWPSRQIEPLCDALLELSKTTDQYLVSGVFNAFEGLFSSMNDEIDKDRFVAVLNIIFDLKPSVNDVHLAASWLAVVAKAVSSYAKVDSLACLAKLPDVFKIVMQYFASDSENIYISASQCLIAIIVEGIEDNSLLQPSKSNGVDNRTYEAVDDVITEIAEVTLTLCGVKYAHAAKEVMELLTAIFTKLRVRSNPDFLPHLEQVGNWRSDEERFQYKAEADAVISSALLALGPEVVISVLPLNLDRPDQVGRAWLLPLLRDNIRNAKLGFFLSYFSPLLEFFAEKVENAEDKQSMHIKIFQTIIDQVWSLLPHFCDLPLDLRSSFTDEFAAKLSGLLYEKVELRVTICHSLKLLVESNLAYADGALTDDLMMQQQFPESEAKKNVKYLAAKASKILSVLFNVFTQTAASSRGYVLETIDAYLQITPKDELEATFNKVCGILKNAMDEEASGKPSQKKESVDFPKMSITMMDLVVAMSKYVPETSHNALLTIFNQTLTYQDASIQKRSYRILTKMFETEAGVESAKKYLRDIESSIIASTDSLIATAKASRLAAIVAIIDILPSSDLFFIPSVLSEIIMATKNVNEKTRELSYAALIKMGNKMEEGGVIENSKVPSMDPEMPDSEANLETYFTMCSAGLVGSTPHMVSAAITAMSCLLYEFRPRMNTELLLEISTTVELFLESNNREVVKSAIGFVKVAVLTLPIEIVAGNLGALLPNLMRWSHEHKGHFKSKIKHIIERMIRRFGYDTIEANFPEEDKKLLLNIKKSKDRAKRKQQQEPEQEKRTEAKTTYASAYDEALYKSSDEEDSDEEMEEAQAPRRGDHGNNRYISESKGAPLDLLDRQAISRITSSNPKNARKPNSNASNFKSRNGRIVIDAGEDEDPFKGKDSGLNAYVEAVKQGPVRGQRNKLKFKRGKNARDDDFGDDDEDDKPVSRPNGRGNSFAGSRGGRVSKPRGGGPPRGGPKFKSRKKL